MTKTKRLQNTVDRIKAQEIVNVLLDEYGLKPEEVALRTGACKESVIRWAKGRGILGLYEKKLRRVYERERAKRGNHE